MKRITPLFSPLIAQLVEKQLTEALFHNDETGWKVFESMEGKVGDRWWLWVTQSSSVVYYTLAPSRSGDIPIDSNTTHPNTTTSSSEAPDISAKERVPSRCPNCATLGRLIRF